jgi:hypothetical protein
MEYISKMYLSLSQFNNMYYMFIEDINEGFHFILHSNHITIIYSHESQPQSFIAPFSPPSFLIAFLPLSKNHISMIVLMTKFTIVPIEPFSNFLYAFVTNNVLVPHFWLRLTTSMKLYVRNSKWFSIMICFYTM